jgi:NAD kinase
MAASPRVIVVTRPTEYEQLLATHGTHGQAAFFLRARNQDIDEAFERHQRLQEARRLVLASVPAAWRRSELDRSELDRFLFGPEDLVVALGQDGLVANVAKYLDGQPVIGVNPDPSSFEGVLVRHDPAGIDEVLHDAQRGTAAIERRAMVAASTSDGRRLLALNEVFVGHRSHQSARYEVASHDARETQSSTGLVVVTGTGATGWGRSIHRGRVTSVELPNATDRHLVYFVREAWPSIATGTDLVEGIVDHAKPLTITSRMDVGGVCFGDGIETDHLDLRWGEVVHVAPADRLLHLVTA